MCAGCGCRAVHGGGGQWQSHGPLPAGAALRRGARADECGDRGINHLWSGTLSTVPVAPLITGALEEARQRTLDLVARLSDEDVETAHSALMSPLAWDLAHIAAYEDLWPVRRHGGEPL